MIEMGKVNWFMPAWLDRLLPRISIEGAEFFQKRERRSPGKLEPEPELAPALRS
jgi:hypothetical protein